MKKLLPATAIALLALASARAQTAPFPQDLSAWTHRMEITFSGYTGAPLTNFPALVRFDTPTATNMRPDGADLRFMDVDGNALPHEVDSWDAANGFLAWVCVPVLTNNAQVVAYFGNLAAAMPENAAETWDEDFIAVMHFNDDNIEAVRDSVATPVPARLQNTTTRGNDGAIGRAVNLTGGGNTNARGILIGTEGVNYTSTHLQPGSEWTVSVWFKDVHTTANYRTLLRGGNNHHLLMNDDANHPLGAWFNSNPANGATALSWQQAGSAQLSASSEWRHLAVTGSGPCPYLGAGSETLVYLDGVEIGYAAFNSMDSISHINCWQATQQFTDYLDEVRVSKCVRSLEWIQAEHATVTNENFAAFGAVEENPLPVVAAFDADPVDANTATANGSLLLTGGSGAVDVHLFWGLASEGPDPLQWSNQATETHADQPLGAFHFELFNLGYSTDYQYCFLASNTVTGAFAWSNIIHFKTLGQPFFNEIGAEMLTPNSIQLFADIGSLGPGDSVVTCWFGESENGLSDILSWQTGAGATNLTHTLTGLQIGGTYYYAFDISATLGAQDWFVASDTNSITLTGTTTWQGLGETTDWSDNGNWDYGVPGASATAQFIALPGNAPITVTATNNAAVGTLNLRSGESAVTFDLGASTLTAAAVNVGIQNQASGNLTLASGFMETTGAFLIGYNSGNNEVFLAPGSWLKVGGRLTVSQCANAAGAINNRLTVEDGAVLEVLGATYITDRAGDIGTNNNELLVRGLYLANGIELLGNYGTPYSYFTVDGGVVTNTATTIIGRWNANYLMTLKNGARFVQAAGSLRISDQALNAQVHVLDGSTLDILDGFLKMNWYGNSNGENGCLVVSNATLRVSGAWDTSVGWYQAWRGFAAGYADARANGDRVYIYEDPGHTTLVTFGIGYIASENSANTLLSLNGGTLEIDGTLSTALATSFNNNRHNKVEISGRTTKLRPNDLNLRNDASLVFNLPLEGFDETPVVVNGNASINNATLFINNDANNPKDDESRVEIHLGKFTGSAILLEAATGNLDLIRPENIVVFQAPANSHRLTVESNLLKIDAWVAGTLFLLK